MLYRLMEVFAAVGPGHYVKIRDTGDIPELNRLGEKFNDIAASQNAAFLSGLKERTDPDGSKWYAGKIYGQYRSDQRALIEEHNRQAEAGAMSPQIQ